MAKANRAQVGRQIQRFLEAFLAMHKASHVALWKRHELAFCASARAAPDPVVLARMGTLVERVDARAARTPGTSHAEIIEPDAYAMSFWFGAHLVALFDDAFWAKDFARHRARALARELCEFLAELDDEPPAPADSRPVK